MDTYSSGEDLVAKTRKPYTITKQRERWTDEEHNRFLEALKLYGRAWQRIEEHIGTKTAVQIRSHAQKFFSKLEKEALVKGIPIGQAIDIEIPPPRPKRKPNNPYPRKNSVVSATQGGVKDGKLGTSGSSPPGKQGLDLEKEPLPDNSIVDGEEEYRKDNHGNDLCSEFTIYQETPSTVASDANISTGISNADAKDSCNFTEFIPLVKNDKSRESHLTDGPVAMDVLQNDVTENKMQGAKNFPRHVPVHILDGSEITSSHAISSDVSFQESAYQQQIHRAHPAVFANPATTESTSSRPANHHKLSSFHSPFHPFRGTQEDYSSLLQVSSTFSSLIVSTLLQNPAAHAAAIFAASFLPCRNAETSTDSLHGGFPTKHMNPTPGMTAIAAATVAAATAWWAAHGLLPMCPPPYHNGAFTCPPETTTTTTAYNTCHPADLNVVQREDKNNIQNCSELKSPASSSESGDQSSAKGKYVLISNDQEKKNPAATEQQNKNMKPVDRSSCGSNSSSEADALEKHEEDKEENKEADAAQAAGESSSRRSKYFNSSFNDSWKEVSEVGRIAFQALFLREILPQSFSPPHDFRIELEHHTKKNDDLNRQISEQSNEGMSLNLNSNITESCSRHHETEKNRMVDDVGANEGLLTAGLTQGKLKARRTGFKPYKRCSVEARESRMSNTNSQDQEKGPKRIRLGEEASS